MGARGALLEDTDGRPLECVTERHVLAYALPGPAVGIVITPKKETEQRRMVPTITKRLGSVGVWLASYAFALFLWLLRPARRVFIRSYSKVVY